MASASNSEPGRFAIGKLGALLLAVACPAGAARIATALPPGFEALPVYSEMRARISVNGRFAAFAWVAFGADWISLDDPGLIAAAYPGSGLAVRLSGRIPRAASCALPEACSPGLSARLDRMGRRLDLRVPLDWLPRPTDGAEQTPPPSNWSLMNRLDLSAFGSGARGWPLGQAPEYGARLAQSYARGRSVLIADQFLGKGRLRAERFFARRQMDTLTLGVGLESHTLLAGQPALRLLGLSLGTDVERLGAQADGAGASPIELNLSQASTVLLLRDGVIESAAPYPAGYQQIDTRALPEGAYELEIQIHAGGTVQTQRQFFINIARLPTPERRIFGFWAGFPQQGGGGWLGRYAAQPVLGGGVRWRAAQRLVLGADTLLSGQRQSLQLAGRWFLPDLSIDLRAFGGPRGGRGALVQLSGRLGSRWHWRSFVRHAAGTPDPRDPVPATTAGRSLSLEAFSGWAGGQLSLRAQQSRHDKARVQALNLRYTRPLRASWLRHSRFTLALGHNDGDPRLQLDFQLALAGHDRTSLASRLASDTAQAYDWRLRHDTALSGGHRLQASLTRTQVGLGAELKGLGQSFRLDLRQQTDSPHSSQLTVQSRLGWLVTAAGAHWFHRDPGRAGVLVQVDGGGSEEVDVLVNGQGRGRVSAAAPAYIPLPPYSASNLKLLPAAGAPLRLSASGQSLALMPGQYGLFATRAQTLHTLFGRASQDITRVVLGAAASAVEAGGFFVLEATDGDLREDLRLYAGRRLRCHLPAPVPGARDIGDLRCPPDPAAAALPGPATGEAVVNGEPRPPRDLRPDRRIASGQQG